MTIPGLIILNLLVGTSIAYSSKVQISSLQRPVFYNRYFTALLMFEIMTVLPVGLYFNGFYEDWSWMYLIDSRTLSPMLTAMALLSYPVAAAMGYLVGYFSARSNSNWVSVMFMFFLAAGFMGLIFIAHDKFLYLGTFDQFQNSVNLTKWTASSLLPSHIVAIAGIGIAWGFIMYRFWHEGHLASVSNKK